MARNLLTALAYPDFSDPAWPGWAYRLIFSDGHHESGPMDVDLGDERCAILDEMAELVGQYGGVWSAGSWEWHDHEQGSYLWKAP